MGCLGGCLRLVFGLLWRALFAALVAIVFARVDAYVERRFGGTLVGHLYATGRRVRGKRGVGSGA